MHFYVPPHKINSCKCYADTHTHAHTHTLAYKINKSVAAATDAGQHAVFLLAKAGEHAPLRR